MMKRKIQVGDLMVGRSQCSLGSLTMKGGHAVGLVVDVKRMGQDDLVTLLIDNEIWSYPDCMLKHLDKQRDVIFYLNIYHL